MLLCVLISAAAQLLLKAGMVALDAELIAGESVVSSLVAAPVIWWVMGGLACYALSFVVWLGVLRHLALSLAYPLLSLSYIIVYVAAIAWPRLAEPASLLRFLGVVLVAAGAALVTASGQMIGRNVSIGRVRGSGD